MATAIPDNSRQVDPAWRAGDRVADTFDAMTTSRPYRPALSRQYAIDEIRNGALTQFDPQVVASFLQVMEESSKIRSITGEDFPPALDELEHAPAWYSSLP